MARLKRRKDSFLCFSGFSLYLLCLCEINCYSSQIIFCLKVTHPFYRPLYSIEYRIILFAKLCPTLCDPMDCSKPDTRGLRYCPRFAQLIPTESVMGFDHLILCHSLHLVPLNLSQQQNLFKWVGSLHKMVKVLELQLQHQSFQWIVKGCFPLGLTGLIS